MVWVGVYFGVAILPYPTPDGTIDNHTITYLYVFTFLRSLQHTFALAHGM